MAKAFRFKLFKKLKLRKRRKLMEEIDLNKSNIVYIGASYHPPFPATYVTPEQVKIVKRINRKIFLYFNQP